MAVKLIIVVLFAAAAIAQIRAACICGFGEGKDICSGPKCTPMVVRPAPLAKLNFEDFRKPRVICKQIGGLPGLRPVGDLCSCRQSIVMPALVPKPACPAGAACSRGYGGGSFSSSGSSSSSSSSGSSSRYSYGGGYGGSSGASYSAPSASGSYGGSSGSSGSYGGSSGFGGSSGSYGGSSGFGASSGSGYAGAYASSGSSGGSEAISANPVAVYGGVYSVAADPVSLNLAYKMQNKACGVSEDRLNFGFRKLPIDGSKAQIVKNIPEENLYKLNGQIVELKPITCGSQTMSIDDEAMEDLVHEEFAESNDEGQDAATVKKLSYGEIGFGPARIKSAPFVAVQGVGIVEANPQPIMEMGSNCNDGFVPGNVIIRNIPRQEVYVPGPGNPVDCSDSGEDAVPMRFVSSFSSSASSSASNQNSHHSSYTSTG